MGRQTDFQEDMDIFKSRLSQMETNVKVLETNLAENTLITRAVAADTRAVKEDTKELVEGYQAAKGAYTVLEFIGKAVKPVLWIAGVITITWNWGSVLWKQAVNFLTMLKGGG